MKITLKKGVTGEPCRPLALGLIICARVYEWFGAPGLVITSIRDGEHMPGSLHPRGYAADLRTIQSGIHGAAIPALVNVIKSQLGPAYQVVLEGNHIHVEYDPKKNGGLELPDETPIAGTFLAMITTAAAAGQVNA